MKNDHILSITEMKKILRKQNNEELIALLVECTKIDPKIKEFISIKFSEKNTIETVLEEYKEKVFNVFFPKNFSTHFKIGNARKIVNDFKKLCKEKKYTLDLMLYYVEMGVEFTNTYGDIDEPFYNSIESMYEAIINILNDEEEPTLYKFLSERLKAVVDNTTDIGWGFHDVLCELYYSISWTELSE